MPHCSAINCSNGSKNGVKVHTFPKEATRRSQWIQNCRRDNWSPNDNSVLCDVHFEEGQFESKRQDGKRFLKWNAIPTLFDVPNKPKPVTLRRINPLDRKRTAATSTRSSCNFEAVSGSVSKHPCLDHEYCKVEMGQMVKSYSINEHSYAARKNIDCDVSSTELPSQSTACENNGCIPMIAINDETTDLKENNPDFLEYCMNVSCRTTAEHLRLQIRQLQRKVNELQCSLTNQSANVRSFLADDQVKFLQSKTASRNKGIVWSLKTVREAFQIRYICGAQGYEFIRSLNYPLPSYRTLCDRIQQSPFNPGIQTDIVHWMQLKLQRSAVQERDCVLMLDEMMVRKNLEYDKGLRSFVGYISEEVYKHKNEGNDSSIDLATHALVVMIRGLTTKWKQVISYYLTGNSVEGSILWNLVKQVIVKLNAVDINVRAVVCDMGSCNRAMWRAAGVGACKEHVISSVVHPVMSNQMLYFLPDVPHVLKNIRNCLLMQDILLPSYIIEQFKLPGPIVTISHVKSLLDLQESSELKITPSLKRKHIQPMQFEKMKVRYAAQLLSHSVSSALRFCVGANLLPSGALTTAWFLETMNEWFDVANARTKLQALHPTSTKKVESLKLMMLLAKQLCFQSRKSATVISAWKPIQTGLLMASKSLIDMHADLVLSGYYKFLMTSRLTQDALENLFSQVRGRGDSHPTPIKFRHNLRLISISQFTKTPKSSSYDTVDDTCYAAPLLHSKCKKDDLSSTCDSVSIGNDLGTVISVFSGILSVCEQNALAYLAGWIAFKLKSKILCNNCRNWLISREINEGSSVADLAALQLTLFKSYGGEVYGLTLPSHNMLNLVQNAESVFLSCKQVMFRKIDLQQLLLDKSAALLCQSNIPQCHGLSEKILKKFFKIRLHAYCKAVSKPSGDETQHGSKSAKSRTVIK